MQRSLALCLKLFQEKIPTSWEICEKMMPQKCCNSWSADAFLIQCVFQIRGSLSNTWILYIEIKRWFCISNHEFNFSSLPMISPPPLTLYRLQLGKFSNGMPFTISENSCWLDWRMFLAWEMINTDFQRE